ncbi:general substrate transporter [Microdochium bolleyi]|uniref:General substrate transporter n=1 Tax=Microdochium bolleyi TaxID=196109 RepID=A0A136IKZ7_9PEZI|nr:general substrate transporter [Microdochium bolleyi]
MSPGATETAVGDAKANAYHNEAVVEEIDREQTPWQCLKQNPKIVLWSLFANRKFNSDPKTVGICLVGYENLVLSVCLAMPAFQMTFAELVNGIPTIPAHWVSLWNATYNLGMMLGSLAAGIAQDKLGRKVVMALSCVLAAGGIAVAFTAATSPHFLGSKILTGFAVGMLQTATTTYVSEIAPLPMRGIALSANIIMLNLGLLIAISSTFSRVAIMDPMAYKVLFAAAWVFPAVIAIGLPFMPESPYWLTMKGRTEDAIRSLKRLSGPHEDINARAAQIDATIEHERQRSAVRTSFLECFRGSNLRRTMVILICMYMPQVCGAVLSSNAPYFLNQTGLDSKTVLLLTQVGISAGVLSALFNIYFMMKFTRRTLMLFGVILCSLMYMVMGIGAVVPRSASSLLTIGVALQFTSITYGPAIGSSMAVAGEISATRLRAKSVGIGYTWSCVVSIAWTIVLPYLFNSDQANLGGNIGWIFFGMGLIMLVFVYFFVPETKGRSFDELDLLFEKKLPARAFRQYDLTASGRV